MCVHIVLEFLLCHVGDEMRIWYGEDLYKYTDTDNHGTSCADVYIHVEAPGKLHL